MRGLKQEHSQRGMVGLGRTPPGVRGLKRHRRAKEDGQIRRTPPGVRGLKQEGNRQRGNRNSVAPHPGCVD